MVAHRAAFSRALRDDDGRREHRVDAARVKDSVRGNSRRPVVG
jgi:hypothetical protein